MSNQCTKWIYSASIIHVFNHKRKTNSRMQTSGSSYYIAVHKKNLWGLNMQYILPPPPFSLSLNIIFIINLLSTFIIENIMYSLFFFFFNQMFNIASFLMKCFSKVTVHVILYLTGENISWFLSVTFGGFISSTWIQLFQVFWTKNCVVNIILFH